MEPAELVFDNIPEVKGNVDNMPWLFIHSKVFVTEKRLEGPRDIGNHYIMDNDDDGGGDGKEE